jgi:hypothetical protein
LFAKRVKEEMENCRLHNISVLRKSVE